LWDSADAPPDVLGFLQQQTTVDSDQWLAVLLSDQKRRWLTENPLQVEDYLVGLPDLPEDVDWKLQLAIGEFEARRDTGQPLSQDEISSRFADISDTLRDWLQGPLPQGPHNRQKLTKLHPELMETEIRVQDDMASTVTYISSTGIGVEQKGRYRLDRVLGEGGFGRVYLGFDEELQRQVAIKVPKPERFQHPEDADQYLEEARIVASLDHPNIVSVYDMGRTDDGSIYVVSKYIEGCTLSDRIRNHRPDDKEAAGLLVTIAQALQYAHERRLIHRDIKPGNILIEDSTDTPYVTDFGLAIREEDYLKGSRIAGTPAYMSPEQALGEGHRLDGRSDIFSLGVILYELLTGRKPFRGNSTLETLQQISSQDPRPPRELVDTISPELERICLKALSKRVSDRYATAAGLADDLLHWQQGPRPETGALQIVPKGLRSFDADDADFFLELLPGPRNRHGLPDSIQFWKTRIEQTDPDKTFSVGLIYGPSGCGKSSLMKAGLLPRLSQDVTAIYVEATPDETETRILHGLRKQLPELPADLGLVDTFARLRRDEGSQVVVVLDQFEQWLHAHRSEEAPELVAALRQCDGGNIQSIVMVRDDFWMAVSRFMKQLEVRLL
ncbi:MAG: serine/threonine-protein kinase, partial [Fuerstiella sp.]